MSWRSLALSVFLLGSTVNADAAESPFFGTWVSNLIKSNMTNQALAGQHLLIVVAPYGENGWTRVQIDVKDPLKSGREEHYSAKFDGQDYLTFGGDPRAIVLTRIDDHTIDTVTKRNGKVASHQRIVVSADGKTMTSTGAGVNGRGEPYENQIQVLDRLQ
jgi:hypothetical protein